MRSRDLLQCFQHPWRAQAVWLLKQQGGDWPEAKQQQVVELVLTQRAGHSDEEGLAEQRGAGVVVARLLVLFSQVHWDHHMLCVLHSVYCHLEAAKQDRNTGIESRLAFTYTHINHCAWETGQAQPHWWETDYFCPRQLHSCSDYGWDHSAEPGHFTLVLHIDMFTPRTSNSWLLCCHCLDYSNSHIDVITLHDTAQVFIGGKDSVKAVVVDICDNHLHRHEQSHCHN